MSRDRRFITLPLDLMLDDGIPANARIVYVVIRSCLPAKAKPGQTLAVIATHRELTARLRLSPHTLVKALNQLEAAGWLRQERISGSANRYVLTTPAAHRSTSGTFDANRRGSSAPVTGALR